MTRWRWLKLGLIVVGLAAAALLPCISTVREDYGYLRSASSLRGIGYALRNYHDVYGKLPPAIVRDKEGKPLYSWRVVLLPFVEQNTLYSHLKLDEPWDSPANAPLVQEAPRCYRPRGHADPPDLTRFQVLIGPGTAFERDGLTWADFPKGPGNTILVVEGAEPVPWAKPADLTYDPAGPLPAMRCPFSKPKKFLCYEVRRQAGFNALFGDETTRFIPSDTDERTLRKLITRE